MSKYDKLWQYFHDKKGEVTLSFAEIEKILGFPIDHSFLRYKKELAEYSYRVGKISLKEKKVLFVDLKK